MKPISFATGVLALWLALADSAAAQEQKPARVFDVLGNADFAAATQRLESEEQLEFAAHLNMVLRQHDQAIPIYEALVKRAPHRADLWALLAAAYNRIDEPREALDAAGIAITLLPEHPHFYAERGIAAFRLGMHERSIDDLKVFVKAFPVNARGHYYLGLAQAARGDTDAAFASLLRARALNPALMVLTDYYLGLIAAQRGQIATARELLTETQRAFKGTQLPVTELVTSQLDGLDGAVASRIRAAVHQTDVQFAPTRHAPANR